MLTLWGDRSRCCDSLSRRNFLQLGGLGLAGLTLADLFRHEARAATAGRSQKAVIMIGLPGGPSQFESYDLKPDAPADIRGEFKPIQTKVPGFQLSEMFPLQAQIADKLAVVRGVNYYFDDAHSQQLIYTGYGRPFNVSAPIAGRIPRPAFGCVYSHLKGSATPAGMPSYVSLVRSTAEGGGDGENPAYVGPGHRAFTYGGQMLKNLGLPRDITLDRLADRKDLLRSFDTMQRQIDQDQSIATADVFTRRALDILSSPQVRDAFDLSREPAAAREKYGKDARTRVAGFTSPNPEQFLLARRLVEAGTRVVTLQVGQWDTHSKNFEYLRHALPVIDRAIHALITDLHERGLDKEVAVLMWGEMGRTPKINQGGGRDHWADSGFAFFAGGGLQMGQAIGATDSRGERAKGKRYSVQNVLSTVYRVLGIDPETTLIDHTGRPQYLLDERDPVAELI
ncbi:MAG: DUF1501 domain-containing protein [Gemmataceae bacterium]